MSLKTLKMKDSEYVFTLDNFLRYLILDLLSIGYRAIPTGLCVWGTFLTCVLPILHPYGIVIDGYDVLCCYRCAIPTGLNVGLLKCR